MTPLALVDVDDLADQGWRVHAACRGADPTQFFPDLTGGGSADLRPVAAVAWRYCEGCPVLAACGELAERTRSVGIWAGAYRRQRGDTSISSLPLVPAASRTAS